MLFANRRVGSLLIVLEGGLVGRGSVRAVAREATLLFGDVTPRGAGIVTPYPAKKGLCSRSFLTVVRGPWPGQMSVSSGKESNFSALFRSAFW